MVTTIAPVVHGGKRSSYLAALTAHVLGATLAAGALGAALGAAGSALGAPWGLSGAGALTAAALLYAARELAGLPVPIPARRAQVPDWWRTFFSPRAAAFLYGAGLGAGFLTYLSFGTFVVVAVGAAISGDPAWGAALCAPFGLARGLSVTVAGLGHRDAENTVQRLEDLAATRFPAVANGLALLLVGAGAALAL